VKPLSRAVSPPLHELSLVLQLPVDGVISEKAALIGAAFLWKPACCCLMPVSASGSSTDK